MFLDSGFINERYLTKSLTSMKFSNINFRKHRNIIKNFSHFSYRTLSFPLRCKYGGSYRSCGVPWSCCLRKLMRNRQCGNKIRKKRSKIDLSQYINTIGCLDAFFELMRSHLYLIGGIAVSLLHLRSFWG